MANVTGIKLKRDAGVVGLLFASLELADKSSDPKRNLQWSDVWWLAPHFFGL